jgi:hypothetical protein
MATQRPIFNFKHKSTSRHLPLVDRTQGVLAAHSYLSSKRAREDTTSLALFVVVIIAGAVLFGINMFF